ncbi:outer-membrane lipoprotein carrier protein LolA [Thiomicrorhabdus sp.]|uniref:LolA family protein n=1 Tax=Thiomicrorhabdus sp. TaxID=2039724 RepID=UPI0029C7302E|nr:outer-membrane lipoprotein carrier protein LolA [Thiomicrorhabdus sp.]
MLRFIRKKTCTKWAVASVFSLAFFSQSAWSSSLVLQDYVNQLQTFKADFEQIEPNEELFQLYQSFGHFELQRPGKLMWEYQRPQQQKIVVDGKNLWVFDTDLEQVTVRPIGEVKSEIPLSWLLYSERIEDKFTIVDAGQRKGLQWFNLAPKEATYFQSIEVGLKDGHMQEVWLYQGPDTITKVRFHNIEENVPLSPDQFRFKVPYGVDVIGQPS